MTLIKQYLKKQNFVPFIPGPFLKDAKIMVVIPCRDEPDLPSTIHSLELASLVSNELIEVIIVVNDRADDLENVYTQNKRTIEWIKHYQGELKIQPIYLHQVPNKKAGVGLARKTGMDEAVYRFSMAGENDGIICSLDADTTVLENYFEAIRDGFERSKKSCLVIEFEHKIEGLDTLHAEAIENYESHLRYYVAALRYAGFEQAFQTIGSAFAVKANAYAGMGGMPPRQAGEDFYFINKFSKIYQVAELRTTKVFPSARISHRVPFGTGKAIGDALLKNRDLGKTYPLSAFMDLKLFIDNLEGLYLNPDWKNISLPETICSFLEEIEFHTVLDELKSNTSNFDNFRKRFFQKMDAFMMMKYIHFARDKYYGMDALTEAISNLKKNSGKSI
ncbi:MAG: glycosyltransferase family A protein [Saprospiraceae bacterium]